MIKHTVTPEVLRKLREFDTCTVSNAIDRLAIRLRNEGFTDETIQCRYQHLPPMLGYAVTGRLRSSSPPIAGGCYYDHMDWWRYVISLPEPRVIVMQDIDTDRGAGAWFGEIHAAICGVLGCAGYVTNGLVRDVAAVRAMRFPLFSGGIVVSHAYAHVVDFGAPVEIGGLKIMPGDLLHGDANGLITIPVSIAAEIPAVAAEVWETERELIRFCRSPEFSLEELPSKFRELKMQPSGM